jgi:UDP-N-acetylmuramoyl-L-alanyl-D-glutamate--2,6-diaminopimelate ligase
VRGTRFRVAVFTNLTQDHLDFHGTIEEYFAAKARLFEPAYTDAAVVNADDPHGALLVDAANVPTRTYSIRDVDDLTVGAQESRGRWRGHALRIPLGGRFNVSNALAALTATVELGVDPADGVSALSSAPAVPGRFEVIDTGRPFRVVVDFAHTPDGLEQALRAAREVTPDGRVIVVFGAGGDKDRAKRPLMGAAAARWSDVVIVTSDNPRSEDPAAIAAAIVGGTSGAAAEVRVELDRRAAIALALAEARPGDLVVVAGKGHETEQVIGTRVVPFDDRLVVREELER